MGSFTNLTGQTFGSVVTSNSLTIAGPLADAMTIATVRGDSTSQLELNGDGNWSKLAAAKRGDTIKLRVEVSSVGLTTKTTSLFLGGRRYDWSVTSAAAPPWVPTDLGSSLRGWWKMDALGLSDNASITTITDYSGLGHDLTNATSGERPIYKTGILNGMGIARFDGSRRMFTNTFAIGSGSGISLYAVYRLSASGSYPMVLVYKSNTGWELRHVGATRYPNFIGNAGAINYDSGSALTIDQWYQVGIRLDDPTDACSIDVNGTAYTATSSQAAPTSTENFYLGGRSDGYYLTGDIAEAVVVNTAMLSGSAYRKLQGYLAHKWGLAADLPSDHPYKSAPP